MKIYNKIILQWNEETQNYDNVVYEDSFDYDGPLMLMDGTCSGGALPSCNHYQAWHDYGYGDEENGCTDAAPWYCEGYQGTMCSNIYNNCLSVPEDDCTSPCSWVEATYDPYNCYGVYTACMNDISTCLTSYAACLEGSNITVNDFESLVGGDLVLSIAGTFEAGSEVTLDGSNSYDDQSCPSGD